MYQEFPRVGAFEVYYEGHVVFSKLRNGSWPSTELIVRRIEVAHRNVLRGKSWNAGLMLVTKSGGNYQGLKSQYGLDSSFSGASAISNSNSAQTKNVRFASQNSNQNRLANMKKIQRIRTATHSSEQGPEARSG